MNKGIESSEKKSKKSSVIEMEMVAGFRTAVLVDGSFFFKRYYSLYPNAKEQDGMTIANTLYTMIHKHVEGKILYRILYYDCAPLSKRVHMPVSKKCIVLSQTKQAIIRTEFLEELKRKRKVALRLGELKDFDGWVLKPSTTKELLQGKKELKDICDDDFSFGVKQKGVDMRIGLDIASLAYKKLVQQIILISGDSDFVPAAKVARREGIDFILDPMWHRVDPALFEHIDGMRSVCPKPE